MIVLALALADDLQSLTFQTLGVIRHSHMRWRARLAVGKARAQAALGHAALRTFGDGSSSTGHRHATCGDGSYARVLIASHATGLAASPSHRPLSDVIGHRPRAPPAIGPSALSSSVNRGCKDLVEEGSCPSEVRGGRTKK